MAPTPFIIGVPSSFLLYKRNFKLPDDVWLVDLDTNKIIKPTAADDLPPLPEPEGSTLKNHFKQVLASMSITNPAQLKQQSITSNNSIQQQQQQTGSNRIFDPLSFGNDVDSVDIAARIAMVKFFNSNGLLLNFSEYTRTIRLFPRPVVAFQINSFLHSRPKSSVFLTKFVQTQVKIFLFFSQYLSSIFYTYLLIRLLNFLPNGHYVLIMLPLFVFKMVFMIQRLSVIKLNGIAFNWIQ